MIYTHRAKRLYPIAQLGFLKAKVEDFDVLN